MAIAVGIVYRPTSEWFRAISTSLKSILDWHFESDWYETANLNCLKSFLLKENNFKFKRLKNYLTIIHNWQLYYWKLLQRNDGHISVTELQNLKPFEQRLIMSEILSYFGSHY